MPLPAPLRRFVHRVLDLIRLRERLIPHQGVTTSLRTALRDRRLWILAGILMSPYLVASLMLVFYFDLEEPFAKFCGVLLTSEYESPILYGAIPAILLWCIDVCRGRRRLVSKLVFTLFVAALGTARATQTVSVVQSRYFLGRDAFAHAEMAEFVLTAFNLSVFFGVLAVPLLFAALTWLPRFPEEHWSLRRYACILIGCIGLAAFASSRAEANNFLIRYGNEYGIQTGPETSLLGLLLGWDGNDSLVFETLSPETRERLAAFGIEVNPEADRPFVRDRVFDPVDKSPWEPFATPPDIVIVFVESLSARLLGCYGSPYAGVSPWIDGLAKRSVQFKNYFNHTTPTVTGLHGSLSASYQVAGYAHYASEESMLIARCRVLSLANVLHERGYETTYFGCGSRHENHLGEVMENLGFDQRFFRRELQETYPKPAAGFVRDYPNFSDDRVSDILMCRYISAFMTQPSEKPRLLCVSTIGTHFPYEFGEGIRYGDGSRPLLNSVYRLDGALSENAGFLAGRSDREIVFVLTADHAMFPTPELIEAAGRDYPRSHYDRITLLISRSGSDQHVPVDTLSSSVDFVPTLLHLLDINVRNPFMGWSIFSASRRKPRVLGSQNRYLFVKTESETWSGLHSSLKDWPGVSLDDGRRLEATHLREWLGYLRFQFRENRIW